MVGGLGPCGRDLCCSLFLSDFNPVSIKMAKEQDLPLNPAKISGICGRLMCCLKYEVAAYEEFNRKAPPLWSTIDTEEGEGTVVGYQVPKREIVVELEGGRKMEIPLEQLGPLKQKGRGRTRRRSRGGRGDQEAEDADAAE
jgi:cell fate regulator YaaT (PSP1 superfamily)